MEVLGLRIPTNNLLVITDSNLSPSQEVIDLFFIPIRHHLIGLIDIDSIKFPHIDFDNIKVFLTPLINNLDINLITEIRKLGYGSKTVSTAEWQKSTVHKAMMIFLWHYPQFSNLIENIHLLSTVVLRSTEIHLDSEINTMNFIEGKKFIDKINRERWTRPQTKSEQQSGVSNLGSVSESLLENALCELIDNANFFKTGNNKIQSYGDFVLMCLPNNLWLSVKSNFARERLLASGYTTDIIGVGFFTSANEFTSKSKIRNFQRVGFLAMYLPNIPISEKQIEDNKNTYQEVIDFYDANGQRPLNINGTPFIRSLSELHADLKAILDTKNIANRTAIEF
jgi:hypothetical protein